MVAPEDNRVVGEGASLAEVGTFYRDTTNARAEKKSRPTWVDSYKPSKTRLARALVDQFRGGNLVQQMTRPAARHCFPYCIQPPDHFLEPDVALE